MATVPLWRALLATTQNPSRPIFQHQRSASSISAWCWRPGTKGSKRRQGHRTVHEPCCCSTVTNTTKRNRALGSRRVAQPATSVATEPSLLSCWCLQSSSSFCHDNSSSSSRKPSLVLLRRFTTDNKDKNDASSSSGPSPSSSPPTVQKIEIGKTTRIVVSRDDQDLSNKNNTTTKEQESTSDSTAAPKSQSQPPPPAFLNSDDDDYWDHWREQLRSLPNRITAARILSTPLLSYWIVTQHTAAAVTGCLVAAASDFADGYLARHRNMATTLGTYLDPLADKILINVLSVSLWITGTLPTALVGLWLVRDVALMTATYRYVQSHTEAGRAVMDPLTTPLQINPTTISKVNTALQFVTLAVGIVHPAVVELMSTTAADGSSSSAVVEFLAGPALPALCWTTGTTTILSFASYAFTNHSAFTAVAGTERNDDNTKNDNVDNDAKKDSRKGDR